MKYDRFSVVSISIGIIFILLVAGYCISLWQSWPVLAPDVPLNVESPTDSTNETHDGTLTVSLNQEFTLKKTQTARVSDRDVSLTLKELVYSPCPKGAQCVWSGLDVAYELLVDGKSYEGSKIHDVQNPLYKVFVIDTDYKTYATFRIDAYDVEK